MKILNECSFLDSKAIDLVEEKFNVKYVLESCLKDKNGNWVNFPIAIFYSEEPHPQGSNYMGAYFQDGYMYVTDALSGVEDVIYNGIECNGEVTYSRYRHDYRGNGCGAFIDGGRDYLRYGGDGPINLVSFKVVKDKLEIL